MAEVDAVCGDSKVAAQLAATDAAAPFPRYGQQVSPIHRHHARGWVIMLCCGCLARAQTAVAGELVGELVAQMSTVLLEARRVFAPKKQTTSESLPPCDEFFALCFGLMVVLCVCCLAAGPAPPKSDNELDEASRPRSMKLIPQSAIVDTYRCLVLRAACLW